MGRPPDLNKSQKEQQQKGPQREAYQAKEAFKGRIKGNLKDFKWNQKYIKQHPQVERYTGNQQESHYSYLPNTTLDKSNSIEAFQLESKDTEGINTLFKFLGRDGHILLAAVIDR